MSLLNRRMMLDNGGNEMKEWELIKAFRIDSDIDLLEVLNMNNTKDIRLIIKTVGRETVSSFRLYANDDPNQFCQINDFGKLRASECIMVDYIQNDYFSTVSYSKQGADAFENGIAPIAPGSFQLQRTFLKRVVGHIFKLKLKATNGFKIGDVIEIYGR